jgi:hypothetical protein
VSLALHDASVPLRTEPWFRRPAIAPLLRHRAMSAALGLGGAGQLILTALHVGIMPCPVPELFGIPCPGCGLSRACVALLSGDPHWLQLHALAPIFLIAIAFSLVAAAANQSLRQHLADRVAAIERATAFPALALAAVWLYWLVRVLYAPEQVHGILALH